MVRKFGLLKKDQVEMLRSMEGGVGGEWEGGVEISPMFWAARALHWCIQRASQGRFKKVNFTDSFGRPQMLAEVNFYDRTWLSIFKTVTSLSSLQTGIWNVSSRWKMKNIIWSFCEVEAKKSKASRYLKSKVINSLSFQIFNTNSPNVLG
jgi:hypothetical protein